MKAVNVDLGDRSCVVRVGRDLVPGSVLAETPPSRVLLVTDSNVGPVYAEPAAEAMRGMGHEVAVTTVPAGEETKSLAQLDALYHAAVAAGLDRSGVIVALGGGVVGDLAGFAAATYLRGVRFLQLPTTLLSMVDSSVGGKTGINLAEGKNLVGSFYQPIAVDADLATLDTLPEREYLSGMAEVVKYGVIRDAGLFDMLEADADLMLARDADMLGAVVARCCEIKAEVVGSDERESGLRAILNFGHTLGHAIENVTGYGTWLHGEALSVGMAYAAELSVRNGKLGESERDRLLALLTRYGLPVLDDPRLSAPWCELRRAMSSDKKSRGSVPRFVLAERIGSVVCGCELPEETLRDVLLTANG